MSLKRSSTGFGDVVTWERPATTVGWVQTPIPGAKCLVRLLGKYARGSNKVLLMKDEVYVVVPIGDQPVDSFLDKFVLDRPIDGHELEWGNHPASGWWAHVPDRSLIPFLTSNMRSSFKRDGLCPRCGSKGEWRNLQLVCIYHGNF